MQTFDVREDLELVLELLGLSAKSLANEISVSRMTVSRWSKGESAISPDGLEKFYGFAFSQGLRLNEMHAQLFVEDSSKRGLTPLFHGSKQGITGRLTLDASRAGNDLGAGFYCGESFARSTMFVARYAGAISYFVSLDADDLQQFRFSIGNEWMLAVAAFRGKIDEYADEVRVRDAVRGVQSADYVIAPIADNRMFEIIDSFLNGEITDAQCEHSLSATGLGDQCVLRTQKALDGVRVCRPRYLCSAEKEYYLEKQKAEAKIGIDKARLARRTCRNQGKYIEELFA